MHDASVLKASGGDLERRLARLAERHPAADPHMVADVVRSVLSSMRGDLVPSQAGLLAEIEELGQIIADAKTEIAAVRADEISESHIPLATDELDAIVSHTAAATDSILETCETLDLVAGQLQTEAAGATGNAAASQLQEATTRIYEACSFQDITGQRISKVVTTLKDIERKVAQIVRTFGGQDASAGLLRGDVNAKPGEEQLLNGPQLPSNAMDQTDIDKLLASFD